MRNSVASPDWFDLAPVALLTLSRAGITKEVNLRACTLLGRARELILGRPLRLLIAAKDRTPFLRILGRSSPGAAPVEAALTVHGPTGRDRSVRIVVRRGGDGRTFIALLEGVGKEGGKVARRLVAVERAARESGEARDRFIAMLSHELRTPLTPIVSALELMEKGSWDPAELQQWTQVIRRNVAAEVRLIDDLLDATRIARNKMSLERQPTNVHDVVYAALETIAPQSRAKSLMLEVALAATSVVVDGDPLRLRQVFWNLVSNAVKFTPVGGQMVVRSWNNREILAIEIADSGIGLDGEARERIFLPFEQARPNAGAGLGLGLAIAKGIVDLHGGHISVASPGVGQGTRFVVEIPVLAGGATQPTTEIAIEPRRVPDDVDLSQQPVAPAPPPSPPPMGDPPAPTRILLVDDNLDVLRAIGRLLEIEGYQVTQAASARDAMNVDLEQIDLVLSDIGLPDMTGWDLMRVLRRKHRLTAIAFTGYGTENDARLSQEAGFAAHLVKPVDLDELISTIQRVMAKRAPPEPAEQRAPLVRPFQSSRALHARRLKPGGRDRRTRPPSGRN